jgi:hypothetical protein
MDSDGHVIGVCQVMNKLKGKVFTEDDVAIIEVSIRRVLHRLIDRDLVFRPSPSSVDWEFTILVNTRTSFV